MPDINELLKYVKDKDISPLPVDNNVHSRFSDIPLDINDVHIAQDRNLDLSQIQAPYEVGEAIANSQSTSEKWLNDLGRLGTGAVSATVGGFAMIPALFDAASSMELSAMYENGAVKWAEGLDEWGQEKFKNYYTQRQEEAYKEASIFEKMTYGEKFWGNSVLANAGFMIGAAVDEAIFSALTAVTGGGAASLQAAETGWLAARLARRLAEAGTEVMGSGTNLIKNAYRGFTAEGEIAKQAMMSGLKNSRQLLTSAGYESSVEALQFQKEAYNQVLEKKANELGISKEELENNPQYERTLGELKSGVNSVANGLWLMNLATVGSSNAIGATALFQLEKPILNMLEGVNPLRAFMSAGVEDLAKTAGKEIGKDGVQFAAKNLSMAQKAFNIVKSPLSEGTEEFSQGLYQDVGKRYLEDKYNPNAIDMILNGIPLMADEIGKRLGDSSHSGWEEFASGFMSSLLGLPNVGRFVGKKENGTYGLKNDKEQPAWVGGIFQGIAENRQIQNERNKNAALNNFLSDKNLAEMLDGKLSTDNITTASVKAFPMIMAAQKRLADGIKSGDKFEQNQAKHDLLAYAAIARDKIGQGENFKKDVLAQYDQHAAILQKGVTAESTQEEIEAVANLENIYQGNTTQEKIAEVNRKKKNTEIKLKDIEAGISRAKAFNLSPDLQDRMAVALSNGNNRVSEANSLLKALQASLKLPNIQVGNLSSNELYELLDKHKVATSKHKKISDSLQKDKAEFDSLPDEIVAFEGETPRANKKKKAVKERVDNWTKELDAETARLEKELNKKVSEVDFSVESPLTQYKEAIDKLQGDDKVQAESLFNDVQRAINQHKEAVKEYNLIMNNPEKAQKQEDEAKEKIQRQIEGKPEVMENSSQVSEEKEPVVADKKEIEELEKKENKTPEEVIILEELKAGKIKREVLKEGKTADRAINDEQNSTYNELQNIIDEIKEVSGSLNYMLSKINEDSTDEDFEITEAIIQRVMELKSILSKLESKKKQLETNLEYYTSLEKSGIDSREKIISLRDKTLERISFIDTLIDKINTILKGMSRMLKEYTDKALSLYKQIEKLKNDTGLTFQGDESSLIKYISNASDVFSIPENEHENFYAQVKSAFSKLTSLFQQAEQDSTDIFNLRQQEVYEKELLSEERDILANEVELLNNLLEKSDLMIVEEYVTEEDIILEKERNQKVEQEKIRLAKEKQNKEERERYETEIANLKLEREKLEAEEKEFQEMLKKEHEENLAKIAENEAKEKAKIEKQIEELKIQYKKDSLEQEQNNSETLAEQEQKYEELLSEVKEMLTELERDFADTMIEASADEKKGVKEVYKLEKARLKAIEKEQKAKIYTDKKAIKAKINSDKMELLRKYNESLKKYQEELRKFEKEDKVKEEKNAYEAKLKAEQRESEKKEKELAKQEKELQNKEKARIKSEKDLELKQKEQREQEEANRKKAEKEFLKRQKEQEETARKKAEQDLKDKEEQEKNNKITQKKLQENSDLLFDVVKKGKKVDIEVIESINPNDYKGRIIDGVSGDVYIQSLKSQALAKLSDQRKSPYYSVQSITTIDRADDGYRLGIINSQTEQIEKEREEKIKQLNERDINSLEAIMPNNPNHKKEGLGIAVGDKFNEGSKIIIVNSNFDENYDGRENPYEVITKVIVPALFDENGKMIQTAQVEVTLFNTKEESDKAIQSKYEKVKTTVGKKQEKINKEYDEKLKEIKQYELDLDTPINEDEFEIITASFNTGENTKKVDKNGDPVVGKNPRLENIPNQKGTTIAVVRKGTNKIIGFINDRIFQYKDKNGKQVPFLKPNTRELNPEFNLAWIGMEGKQAEIQDQLNLLSTLTNGSLVRTIEGKLRFPKENATTNLTNIEELFLNPEVSSVSVFQRIYQDGNILYQEWKYNRERKIWEAGEVSDQDRVDANTLAITYNDGHISNISVNVSKENELKWFKSALNNLANKGTTSTSKVGGSVFFTINSDEISQTVVIEENKDGTKVAIKVLKGAKGEKETQVFEWTNIQEYLDLIKTFQSMKPEESLEAFKQFFNEKLKIASDKGKLPFVYKLYTVSFNDESFDKEIAEGKYIIPKMEGKLRVVNVEKADIAANEGIISKDDLIEVSENPSIEDVNFEEGFKPVPNEIAKQMFRLDLSGGTYVSDMIQNGTDIKYKETDQYIILRQTKSKTSTQTSYMIYKKGTSSPDNRKVIFDVFTAYDGKVHYNKANSLTYAKLMKIDNMDKMLEDIINIIENNDLFAEKPETTLDEKIETFEEKSYTQQEIKDYVKVNKENKTDEVRIKIEKMKNWAEKNDGKLFTALSNLLNTFPKTQLSNKPSEITHQKAVEIFKEYFPNTALSLEDVSQVLGKLSFLPNSVVYGVYNGLVRLRQGGTLKDTPFFEGFRLVFNALITDKEKSQILEEARMKYFLGLPKGQKEIILKEFQRSYSPRINNEYVWQGKELENYYLETMLAREFADKATTNKPKSFIQRLFDKIRSWLGINKIDNLFNKILNKEFRDFPYNPKDNQGTIKTMLDVYSSESESGKDLMTSENAYRIANRIFSYMAREKMSFEAALAATRKYYDDLAAIPGILNETKTSLEILSSSINEIDEFDEPNDIGIQNIEKLRKEVEDRKAILSFDPDAVSEEDNNKDIAIRDGENFSQSLRELGGEMSASKKFKEYLSTIMYVDDEFDLFGNAFSEEFKNMSETEQKKFYIPVDFISVYNTMLKLTAGKPKSEIMGILNLMKDTDKQLLAVVNQMNVDVANPQEFDTTLDMILSNLEKQKVQGKIILHDNETGKFDMSDENAQGIENSQINKWASEYEMRHVGNIAETEELLKELKFPTSATALYKALNKYGFKVSRLYCQWCYGLKTGKYENDIIPKIATEYGLTTNNSILDKTNIEYIFEKIINRENENAKLIAKGLPGVETIFPNGDIYFGEKKNEGSRNKLKAVAFGNSIFDSSVKNLSYKNSENKTVYEIIARMQVGDFVNIINKIIKANKQGEPTYDAVRNKIIALNNDNEAIEALLKTEVDGKHPYLSFINSIYNLVQEGKDMENGEDLALKDVQDILIDLGKFIFHNNLENFIEKDDKGNYRQMEIGFLGGYRETSGKIIEDTYIEDEKSKSKAGTTFSSANEQEKTLALLGVWMKGWYNPIVAAGKSMQFIFKGNKLKRITPQKIEDTKSILMNWFDQEIHRIDRGIKGQVSKDIDKYEQKAQKFFENKAFVDSLANTDLKEIYSAFIEVDSKDANLVAAKLQEKKDFIEKYKTDEQFRDNIKEALFDFHNNLSLNFANKTIGTIGVNLPQVLIDKKEKLVENDLNEGTENHRLMINVLQEFYFDDLINSTAFYNTFIGDKAMSLKDYIDVNKRAGKHIAGGVSSETANRNIRAIGMKSIKQMLGVDEDFQIDKDWYSERENYPLKNKDKFGDTDTTDAESYQTVKANIDFYLKSNAKYTKEVHDIYEMINYGIEPSFDWWEKLDKNNAALQKRKMVYADFLQYIKTSVNTLTWQECSVWNNETQTMLEGKTQEEQLQIIKNLTNGDVSKVANLRIALPSRQKMFDLLSLMQKEKIDYVYHDSASKSLQRRIRAKDFGELKAENAHYLNPTYWKEQVATDGVKMEVVDGTQKIQLIFSEQNGEIKVDIGQNTFDLEKVSDTYKQYLANRINMMYEKVLAELQNEDGTINIDELKAGFVKALEKSGSTQQTIKFFKESNINLPHIVEKAESMFMSRVSKVLSHKKSGSALALASPKLYPIMRATTKIELSNGRAISENEVISTETYKKFSSEFIEGKNFAISRLRHGVLATGDKHYYAEIILPSNHPALAYMKDEFIPAEFADMVGIRIPTQDKHSMLSMKVVDVIPAYKGSTVIVPLESILLSGEDFDIDKKYIYWYAGYQTKQGWKRYGQYKDENELYSDYIRTNLFKDFSKSELINLMKAYALDEYVTELENNKYISESDIDSLIEKYIELPNFTKDMFRLKKEVVKSGKMYQKMLVRMEENKAGKLEKTQTNKYELDNDLLDLEKVMVHNNGNNDIAYTPSSMDIVNQAVESHVLLVDKERLRCAEFYGMELATFDALPSSEKVEKIQKFVKEKGYINVYGNHSPLDKLTAYYNNDVGAKNIGVWALSNVVMQTLIKESKHITVDNGAYMLHGIRINDIISSFLSSATDNDKEQHAAILQLDQEKCGIMFDLMWRQGLHPTVALGIIYSGEGGTNLDVETLLALNPNLSETDARFLNDLMQGSEQAMEKQEYLLKSSTNAAKYTMALTTLMSLNKGFKSTIADNQTIVEAIKTLKKGVVDKETGLTLPKPYNGWNIVQSDPHLKEEVDKFEKVYDELTPKVFLVRNEKLRNALDKMTASLKGMNYPTNRTKVYRDLISYVIVNIIKNNDSLVQNYSKIGGEEIFTTGLISKVKTILTPKVDNSLMKGLTAVKKVMKQGEFTGKTIDSVAMNTWLKAVRFVDEKMQNDYERFNRRPHALAEIKEMMEAGVPVDKIIDSFNTPNGLNKLMGTLAKLMYIQSVVKEGLQFKSGSVNSLISTPLFAQTNGLIDRLMNEKNFEEITGKSADQLMVDFIRNFVADESNKSFLPSLYKQEYFMEANEQGDTLGNAREFLKNAGFNFDEKKKVIPAFGINYGKVKLVLSENSIKAMLNDEEFTPIYESIVTKGGKDVVGYRNDDIKPGEKIGNNMYYTGKKDAEFEADLIKQSLNKIKNRTLAEKIYASLPKKTESGNVLIKSVYQQAGIDYAKSVGGIFSLRVNNSDKHFGNPFSSVQSEIDKGLIATKDTKESVEKYIDWVINSQDERAKWIREQLDKGILKGKPIIYYTDKPAKNSISPSNETQPSHANALDYLINNWEGLKNQSVEANKMVQPKSMSEITNHSGGAIGADSMFDKIGKEFGQTQHNHYYFGNKTPLGNKLLTQTEVNEGIVEMNKAAKILGKNPQKTETINLLARNWFQVKNSTQIVAIAPIDNSMKFVEGGTGWAVAMAQGTNKEINVFNLKDNNWYKWNGSIFVKSEIPILHKDFAGIGSRQDNGKMTDESIQAIRDVYEKTQNSLPQKNNDGDIVVLLTTAENQGEFIDKLIQRNNMTYQDFSNEMQRLLDNPTTLFDAVSVVQRAKQYSDSKIVKSPTEIANEIKVNQKSVVQVFENENFDEIENMQIPENEISKSELDALGLSMDEWLNLDKETQDKMRDCNL